MARAIEKISPIAVFQNQPNPALGSFRKFGIPYLGVLIITILGYYIRVPDFQKLPFGFRLYIGFKFRVGHSLLDTALLRELGLGGVVLTQKSRRPKLSGTDDKIRSPQHVGHWSTDRV